MTVLAVAGLAWVAMVLWHGHGGAADPITDVALETGGQAASSHAMGGHAMPGPMESEPAATDPVLHDHAQHHGEGALGGGSAQTMLLWLGGWVIMVLAMMLPPALPFLRVMAQLVQARSDGGRLILASTGAFVLAWVAAGLALLSAGTLLSAVIGEITFVAERPFLPAGAAALLAGAYQFTPLKAACLAACRSPTNLVMTRWRAETPWRAAAEIGLRYGLVCVGCCWALMVLSLVVGALALPVMVATAVIMAAERMLPAVRPLIPLQAAFAGVVGVLLLSGVVPPAFVWP